MHRLNARLRCAYKQAKTIRHEGNLLKSAVFYGLTILRSKRPVSLAIGS